MILTRRNTLKLLAAAAPALRSAYGQRAPGQLTPGPFAATRASLSHYQVPAWFGELKFGIWSHWGPQSAIGDGDWYARNMYVQGRPEYEYHCKRFGHPSKFGYKDTIPLYTADRWDPDHLMDLYVKAGARYFFSMGVHHDNYDLWNSRYQPHWNSVATGPHKDVVGLWAAAARKRGLPFGVSEHLSNSFDWFSTAHLADTTGPLTGVPYDGANPSNAALYHDYTGEPAGFAEHSEPMGREAPTRWKQQYFNRIKDLIDQHHPDLLYTDGGIPFDEIGLATVAELYNTCRRNKAGVPDSIYFSKTEADADEGLCLLDRERGVLDQIRAQPWQTDTCIGQWHYKVGATYKTPKQVIDLLIDIVSKNGNLLLNFPLPASGELDPDEQKVLAGITGWMQVNSEAIHGTRPWRVYGEGPASKLVAGAGFNEEHKKDLTAADIRYTTKPGVLYALVGGWPGSVLTLASVTGQKVTEVRLIGPETPLQFTQSDTGLSIATAGTPTPTSPIGIALRIRLV